VSGPHYNFFAQATGNARIVQAAGDVIVVNVHGPDPDARLAGLVRSVWKSEDRTRSMHNPYLIPVLWRTLSPPFSDYWSTIRPDGVDRPLRMGGDITGIADLSGDPRHRGRVVVLGGAGGGKTGCALRLTLDLLERRQKGDPVPVLLRLSTWNPVAQPLLQWVDERLRLDYGYHLDGRRRGASTGSSALQLLLILDGLDEMPDAAWRRAAIEGINRTLGHRTPLIVTSRTEEYREAVEGGDGRPLTAALTVELQPLTPLQVEDYLLSALPERHKESWRRLLREDLMRSGGALAAALAAPLWVSLAREVGRLRPDALHDLLDVASDPGAVHAALLDMLVPAVYPAPGERSPDGHTWQRDRVREWLSFLARDLVARDRDDIAWWYLANLVPLPVRQRAVSAVYGLPVGVLVAVIGWHVGFGPLALLLIPIGAVVNMSSDLGDDVDVSTPPPARRRLTLRSHPGALPVLGRIAGAVLMGSMFGCLSGAGLFSVFRTGGLDLWPVPPGLVVAAAVGTAIATLLLIVWNFTTFFDRDADPTVPIDTGRMIAEDRLRALYVLAGVGVAVTAALLLVTGWAAAAALGVAVGVSVVLLSRAWGWYQLSRCWLALGDRLPWRLVSFLEDATRRGVLRRVGATYQFRHVALRDRLAAGGPRPSSGQLLPAWFDPRKPQRRRILAWGAGLLVAVGCCGGLALAAIPGPDAGGGTSPEVPAPVAAVDVSPGTAHPGDTVTIHGAGFGPGEQVYVFLTPAAAGATASASYVADTAMKGEFRISVTVPPLKGDEYKISAVGSVTSRTAHAVLLVSS
jgi:hypothetical protein